MTANHEPAAGGLDQRAWVLAAVEAYEGRLLRYAQRIARGNLDEARDAVQYVFLRLCDQQPGEIDGRLAAWLYTVCRNRLIDTKRRDAKVHPMNGVDMVLDSSREADPAEQMALQDEGVRVREVIATLPVKQQESVNLWAEGFSYREISQITGYGEGSIRVLVHRAFQSLRQHPAIRRLLADEAPSVPSPVVDASPAGQ